MTYYNSDTDLLRRMAQFLTDTKNIKVFVVERAIQDAQGPSYLMANVSGHDINAARRAVK